MTRSTDRPQEGARCLRNLLKCARIILFAVATLSVIGVTVIANSLRLLETLPGDKVTKLIVLTVLLLAATVWGLTSISSQIAALTPRFAYQLGRFLHGVVNAFHVLESNASRIGPIWGSAGILILLLAPFVERYRTDIVHAREIMVATISIVSDKPMDNVMTKHAQPLAKHYSQLGFIAKLATPGLGLALGVVGTPATATAKRLDPALPLRKQESGPLGVGSMMQSVEEKALLALLDSKLDFQPNRPTPTAWEAATMISAATRAERLLLRARESLRRTSRRAPSVIALEAGIANQLAVVYAVQALSYRTYANDRQESGASALRPDTLLAKAFALLRECGDASTYGNLSASKALNNRANLDVLLLTKVPSIGTLGWPEESQDWLRARVATGEARLRGYLEADSLPRAARLTGRPEIFLTVAQVACLLAHSDLRRIERAGKANKSPHRDLARHLLTSEAAIATAISLGASPTEIVNSAREKGLWLLLGKELPVIKHIGARGQIEESRRWVAALIAAAEVRQQASGY